MKYFSIVLYFCGVTCLNAFVPLTFRATRLERNYLLHVSSSVDQITSKYENQLVDEKAVQQQQHVSRSNSSALTQDLISKLKYRELRRELVARTLPMAGTTSELRQRLRNAITWESSDAASTPKHEVKFENTTNRKSVVVSELELRKISFTYADMPDQIVERNNLIREVKAKASKGHWKAATRKLKKLSRRFPETKIGEDVYLVTLEACMANRLQGARASEPVRKILEQLVESGYSIPELEGNYCIQNSIGESGPLSTHQGFGGIDTAYAMLAALELAQTPVHPETYERVIHALVKEGAISDALSVLKTALVDKATTPALSIFSSIAEASVVIPEEKKHVELVTKVLAYAKAAGYDLDSISSTHDGRSLLASGVIAAQRAGNEALGIHLLNFASKVEVEGVRGDIMVANHSATALDACSLIHETAISRAVPDGNWKLAVKVLELMLSRQFKPSLLTWEYVVSCCVKAEKSKRATGILLNWIKLYEVGETEKPPVTIFNTVIECCESCGEPELKQAVLNSMKQINVEENSLVPELKHAALDDKKQSTCQEGVIVPEIKHIVLDFKKQSTGEKDALVPKIKHVVLDHKKKSSREEVTLIPEIKHAATGGEDIAFRKIKYTVLDYKSHITSEEISLVKTTIQRKEQEKTQRKELEPTNVATENSQALGIAWEMKRLRIVIKLVMGKMSLFRLNMRMMLLKFKRRLGLNFSKFLKNGKIDKIAEGTIDDNVLKPTC